MTPPKLNRWKAGKADAPIVFSPSQDRHRAILVLNQNNRVVGKLILSEVIRWFEPKGEKIADFKSSSR